MRSCAGRRVLLGAAERLRVWAREHADARSRGPRGGVAVRELERLPELVLDELPADLGAPGRRRDPPRARSRRRARTTSASSPMPGDWLDAARCRRAGVLRSRQPRRAERRRVRRVLRRRAAVGAMTLVTHGVALGCQAATIRRPKPGQRLPRPASRRARAGLAESCLFACARGAVPASSGAARRCARRRSAGDRCGWPRLPAVHQLRAIPVAVRPASARDARDDRSLEPRSVSTRSTTSSARSTSPSSSSPSGELNPEPRPARPRRDAFRAKPGASAREIGLQGLPVPPRVRRRGRDATTIAAALEGARLRLPRQRLDLLAQRADVGVRAPDACDSGPKSRSGATSRSLRRHADRRARDDRARARARMRSRSTTTATARGRRVGAQRLEDVRHERSRERSLHRLRDDRTAALGSRACRRSSSSASTPGSTVGSPFSKMGLRSSHHERAVLHGLRSAGGCAARRTGGAGMAIFNTSMRWERGLILACGGGHDAPPARALRRATPRERVQFGQPIGSLPGRLPPHRRHEAAARDRPA